jgi:hypothetical protein
MSTFKLVVENGNIAGTTGHHVVQVHIEETLDDRTVVRGISETYGIESCALVRRHGGDIHKWREWVAQEMLAKHKRRTAAHAEIMQWSGKKFDVIDNA